MKIKIDINIPLPESVLDKQTEYPFRTMKRGNSFLFHKKYTRKKMKQASHIHRKFSKKNGGLFTVSKFKGGIRIWKIK